MSTTRFVQQTCMLFACAALVCAGSANAAVILTDDSVFGTQSVIRDTTNSREFLQLVHTMGRVADIPTELGTGGDFEGWTIATASDLEALSSSAGITHGSGDAGQIAAAAQLRDWFCIRGLISCVALSSTHEVARGLIADQTQFPPFNDAWTFGRRLSPEEVDARISGFGPGSADEAMFLVRVVSVPVPNSAFLLGLGLTVLWARRVRAHKA